jgi:RsiW-degrading membrane proteinase PrsW (M82 family)
MAQSQWQNLFDTWGTISVGHSRLSVRTVVLIICCLLVLLDVAVQTSTRAIVALSLNAFFVFVAIAASQFTRTVSLRALAFSFLAGIGMMGVCWGLSALTVMALGQNLAWRPFLVAPIEDLCRIAPLLFFLWQGRRFSTCTLGATDVALIGAAAGAGFAFVEDAFASTPLGNSSSPYFWVPATVVYNGHLIAGHTVWSTLAASTIGLGLLLVHNRQQSLILLLSGFAWAMLDHVAMDASIEAPSQLSGLMLFFAANGYLTFGLFVISFVTIILLDIYITFKVPPSYPEFNLPKRNQRKEAITTSWQFIQDRRRFAFALFRHKAQPSNRKYGQNRTAASCACFAQALSIWRTEGCSGCRYRTRYRTCPGGPGFFSHRLLAKHGRFNRWTAILQHERR